MNLEYLSGKTANRLTNHHLEEIRNPAEVLVAINKSHYVFVPEESTLLQQTIWKYNDRTIIIPRISQSFFIPLMQALTAQGETDE